MIWARKRCRQRPHVAGCVHKMLNDVQALCGARLSRPTQYWEEMGEPMEHAYCHDCWQIEEARK